MLLKLLFTLFARIPLPWLHACAAVLGRISYYCSGKSRKRIIEHLQIAQLPSDKQSVQAVFCETAKSGLELPLAFFRQPEHIASLFKHIYGWEYLQAALDNQQGILLLTPHLGSYDLAGRYISEQLDFPLTAMYKPPKIKMLDSIVRAGRERGKGKTAPTNLQGVKQVIQALRQGQATIVLPDHVPNPDEGGGVWVKFFGRYAYTMTLAGKLAQVKNVSTLFFVGERLPKGQGFALHISPLSGSLNGDKEHDAQIINSNIEYWVRRFPHQYLFAYNRYKMPRGAPDIPAE